MKRVILFYITLFAYQISPGQTNEIEKTVFEIEQREKLNGVLLVAKDGIVVYHKAFGVADRTWNIANRLDTKFLIGSLTKQFTAMLVIQQVEGGRINLDGKITTYIPGFRKATGDKITVRHLLTHTHGIPNIEQTARYKPMTKDEFIKTYCEGDLAFEPGSEFDYSNIAGYYLLGVILENATGMEYEKLLREKILSPLGMNNTGCYSAEEIVTQLATGYSVQGNALKKAPYWDMSQSFSAAAMYTTTADLLLWDRALRSDKLVSRKMINQMFSSYSEKIPYGFGWYINDTEINGVKKVFPGHVGGANGYRASIVRGVDDDILVIYLSNVDKYVEVRYPLLDVLLSAK